MRNRIEKLTPFQTSSSLGLRFHRPLGRWLDAFFPSRQQYNRQYLAVSLRPCLAVTLGCLAATSSLAFSRFESESVEAEIVFVGEVN